MRLPDTTVVIPAYNPGPMLREALESVLAQTYDRWQVLIVDDGSSEDITQHVPAKFDRSRIAVLRHRTNRGQSAALNTALSYVRTPYFVQLDPDDLLLPDALRLLHGALERAPARTALVSGNIQMVFVDNSAPPVVLVGSPFSDRYQLLRHNKAVWPRFYRTAALRQIGGWPTDDPYQGRYLEDRRMMYRLIELYAFAWIDEVVYIYRRHGRNITILHANEHNEMVRWVVANCLQRWGSRYSPVFQEVNGVVLLIDLKPAVTGGPEDQPPGGAAPSTARNGSRSNVRPRRVKPTRIRPRR